MGIGANRSRYGDELGHVEPALTQFKLRHERLALTDAFSQLSLGDASIFASLHKQLDHSLVEVGSK